MNFKASSSTILRSSSRYSGMEYAGISVLTIPLFGDFNIEVQPEERKSIKHPTMIPGICRIICEAIRMYK